MVALLNWVREHQKITGNCEIGSKLPNPFWYDDIYLQCPSEEVETKHSTEQQMWAYPFFYSKQHWKKCLIQPFIFAKTGWWVANNEEGSIPALNSVKMDFHTRERKKIWDLSKIKLTQETPLFEDIKHGCTNLCWWFNHGSPGFF